MNISEDAFNVPRSSALLPTEILLMIVERLDGDKQALRSCSLVCHAWVPMSRPQLFRFIYFRPPPKGYSNCFVRFFSFFLTSQSSGSDLGRHVRDLTLMSCRRQVPNSPYGIDKYYYSDDSGSEGDDDSAIVGCQLDVLMSLGSVFRRLERLTLIKLVIVDDLAHIRRNRMALRDDDRGSTNSGEEEEEYPSARGSTYSGEEEEEEYSSDSPSTDDEEEWESDNADDIDDPIVVLSGADCSPLGELRINEVYSATGTLRDIFQVICSFSEIGKLSLEFISFSERQSHGSDPATWFVNVTPVQCPVIRTLDLEDPPQFLVSAFHDLLRRSGGLAGTLQSLRFRGCVEGMKAINAFRSLLADISPNIRELNVDVFNRIYRKPTALNRWHDLGVDHCTALKSLVLPIGRVPDNDYGITADDYAARTAKVVKTYTGWLLEQDALSALRSVTFEIFLNVYNTIGWFRGARRKHQAAWHGMAKALAGRPLERVSIVLFSYKHEASEETKAAYREFFAAPMVPLQSKGILDLSFVRQPDFFELFC